MQTPKVDLQRNIDLARGRPSPGKRLLGFAYFLLAPLIIMFRERKQAAKTSGELLALYGTVSAANPGLTGSELYRQILVARLGGDTIAAEAVLKHATDSYAKWPLDRALSFRDVVHYLAFTDCLAADDSVHWTSENLGNHVAKWIPGDL